MTSTYVYWGKGKIKLTWVKSNELPDMDRITSVHGFCFHQNKVLLINLRERGWDIPGGHIEEGETTEACLKREILEEAYVEGDCSLLGHVIIDHHENEQFIEGGKYPKVGYQVFYKMNITKIHPFAAEYESSERKFIEPIEVGHYHKGWHDVLASILDDCFISEKL